MKILFGIFFLLNNLHSYPQDVKKINQLDSLVSIINASALPVQRDTLVQDFSQLGLNTTTYLSTITNGSELIKFVNYVISIRQDNGHDEKMTSSNTFYFHANKLIKVEEYLIKEGIQNVASWYFDDDKILYYTLQTERSEERARLLLAMGRDMVKKVIR